MVQTLLVSSAVVGAFALLAIAAQLSLIHKVLTSGQLVVRPRSPHSSSRVSPSPKRPGGTAVFVYRDGKWELEGEFSEPGYVAVPPATPGVYEGQAIRTPSQPCPKG